MAVRRQVTIGNQIVWVDSLLEEKMLRWFEANGFAERWERPDKGLNVGVRNYTPDAYLLIEFEGKTHKAIVEIKPVLQHVRYGFSDYIFQRMRIAAKVDRSEMLLLYVDEDQTWYRINNKTGDLSEFGLPIPSKRTLAQSYHPFIIRARSIGNHGYNQRLDYAILDKAVDVMQDGLQRLFHGKKPKGKGGKKNHPNAKGRGRKPPDRHAGGRRK